jgi:hypothetical protein
MKDNPIFSTAWGNWSRSNPRWRNWQESALTISPQNFACPLPDSKKLFWPEVRNASHCCTRLSGLDRRSAYAITVGRHQLNGWKRKSCKPLRTSPRQSSKSFDLEKRRITFSPLMRILKTTQNRGQPADSPSPSWQAVAVPKVPANCVDRTPALKTAPLPL